MTIRASCSLKSFEGFGTISIWFFPPCDDLVSSFFLRRNSFFSSVSLLFPLRVTSAEEDNFAVAVGRLLGYLETFLLLEGGRTLNSANFRKTIECFGLASGESGRQEPFLMTSISMSLSVTSTKLVSIGTLRHIKEITGWLQDSRLLQIGRLA